MDTQYKLANGGIKRSDGAFIPADESNSDYQEYLKWLANGGVPDPADTEPVQVKRWTPFEFAKRFTESERNSILQSTDIHVRDFWSMAAMAQEIIADNSDTVAGMEYLVYAGILDEARKNEILS